MAKQVVVSEGKLVDEEGNRIGGDMLDGLTDSKPELDHSTATAATVVQALAQLGLVTDTYVAP